MENTKIINFTKKNRIIEQFLSFKKGNSLLDILDAIVKLSETMPVLKDVSDIEQIEDKLIDFYCYLEENYGEEIIEKIYNIAEENDLNIDVISVAVSAIVKEEINEDLESYNKLSSEKQSTLRYIKNWINNLSGNLIIKFYIADNKKTSYVKKADFLIDKSVDNTDKALIMHSIFVSLANFIELGCELHIQQSNDECSYYMGIQCINGEIFILEENDKAFFKSFDDLLHMEYKKFCISYEEYLKEERKEKVIVFQNLNKFINMFEEMFTNNVEETLLEMDKLLPQENDLGKIIDEKGQYERFYEYLVNRFSSLIIKSLEDKYGSNLNILNISRAIYSINQTKEGIDVYLTLPETIKENINTIIKEISGLRGDVVIKIITLTNSYEFLLCNNCPFEIFAHFRKKVAAAIALNIYDGCIVYAIQELHDKLYVRGAFMAKDMLEGINIKELEKCVQNDEEELHYIEWNDSL